ncbi:MAG: peptide ABC transporter substrate-binding protein [Alphaproteobacteria bacterium]
MRSLARLCAFALVAALAALAPRASYALEVLHVGVSGEPDSLDPHKSTLIYARIINQQIWLPLVSYDKDGNMIGAAADSWEVSKDGLTYTFHLKNGLKWSDGTPITSADYVYSFRRMQDPKTNYSSAELYYWIKNAKAVHEEHHPLTDLGVGAPDARTLVITLERPNPLFLVLVGNAYAVPEKAIEKWGGAWTLPEHMVCAGPYMVKERVPGTRLTLVKNPQSMYAQSTAIDEVDVYFVNDDTAMTDRFRSGELDLVYSVGAAEFDQIARASPARAVAYNSSNTSFIVFNTRKKQLADARVRRALSMLIDRNIVAAKIVGGRTTPAYSLVPTNWPGIAPRHEPDYAAWPEKKRVAEAKKLLAAAGYSARKPLAIEYIYYPSKVGSRLAVVLKSVWDSTGLVKASLLSKEQAGLFSQLDSGDFQAASIGIDMGLEIDPYDVLSGVEPGGWNDRTGFKSAEYESLMDKVRATADAGERAKLLGEADTLWANSYTTVALTHAPARWFISRVVKGWSMKAEPYFFRNLSIERKDAAAH